MARLRIHPATRSRGIVAVLAMVFLCLFAALAVSFFAMTSMNVAKADNYRAHADALTTAESGLQFMVYQVRYSGAYSSLRGQVLLNNLYTHMGSNLNGTANLAGQSVTYDGTTITIPSVALDASRSFRAQITAPSSNTIQISVTGQRTTGSAGTLVAQHTVTVSVHPTGNPAFAYGLVSKGPVTFGMNTEFDGSFQSFDGSIYSAANGTAISCGSGYISGDVSVSDPNAVISLGGTRVGGTINYNAPVMTMPEIDRTPYAPLATNIVDSHTNTSSGTFKNIRIKAGTNPVFGSVTIMGVMYIESPNNVQFTNNVSLIGVIVADDPAAGTTDAQNYIYFKNNTTFQDVDQLPDTSEFHAVRQLSGTSVLAPGFVMEFKNNFTTISGTVALKEMIAKNNLSSNLFGNLLIYGSSGITFKNNTEIHVDRSKYGDQPPGFKGAGAFVVDSPTYVEK